MTLMKAALQIRPTGSVERRRKRQADKLILLVNMSVVAKHYNSAASALFSMPHGIRFPRGSKSRSAVEFA